MKKKMITLESMKTVDFMGARGAVRIEDFTVPGESLLFVQGKNNSVGNASSNMSGKTMVFNAITWALYGVLISGKDPKRDVIHTGCSQAEVWITLMCGNESIDIQRTRKRSGTPVESVTLDNGQAKGLTAMRPEEAQVYIDSVFGNVDLFLAANVFGNEEGSTPFALRTDAHKKDLLDLLISSSDLDLCLEETRDRKILLAAEVATTESILLQQKSSIVMLKELRTERLNEISVDKKHIEESMKEAQEKRTEYEKAIKKKQERIDEMEERLCDRRDIAVTTQQEIDSICKVLDTARKGRDAAKLALSNKDQTDCSTCGQELLSEAKVKLQQDAQEAADFIAECQSTIRDANVRMKTCREYVSDLELEQNSVQSYVDRLRGELKLSDDALLECQVKVNGFTNQLSKMDRKGTQEFDDRIVETESSIISNEKLLRVGENKLSALGFLIEAFGPKGIKAYRVEALMPMMNSIAYDYSKALFGNSMCVEYSTQKLNQNGTWREDMQIQLVMEVTPLHAKRIAVLNPSAGQAHRRDIVHTLTVAELARRLKLSSISFSIYDEVFRSLDDAGIEAIIKILRMQQKDMTLIMVAEHNEEFAPHFDRTLTAERSDAHTVEYQWA